MRAYLYLSNQASGFCFLFTYWVILYAFCRLLILFQNQLFRKISSGIPSECQTVWIQISFNVLSGLTLKAPIATKVPASRLQKCLRSLYDSVNPDQTAPIGAVWSGSILFASILKFVSKVRQLLAADDLSRRHFQMHFFLAALRIKTGPNCLQRLSGDYTSSRFKRRQRKCRLVDMY